jgi:hypothetical protein
MESRRLRMEDVIDIQRVCIRLDRCVGVVPGPINTSILCMLEDRGFDQAPVYDPSIHCYWGLVETSYLRSLLESGQPLSPTDPTIRSEDRQFHVGSFVTIFGLLEKMAVQRAVVVVHHSDATEFGHAEFIWGLFTISDLNRHAIRSVIYHLLADVESGLAKWLESYLPDPWDWLKHLDEEQQARVLGYWELSRRQGVDVGPVAALNLAHLFQIFSRHDSAAELLGYPSRTQFVKATGRLPRLRNNVMHPVRPLVLTQTDVGKVYQALLILERLRDQVETLIGKEEKENAG